MNTKPVGQSDGIALSSLADCERGTRTESEQVNNERVELKGME